MRGSALAPMLAFLEHNDQLHPLLNKSGRRLRRHPHQRPGPPGAPKDGLIQRLNTSTRRITSTTRKAASQL